MTAAGMHDCARCAELERKLQTLVERVARLEAELAAAKKDSRTSSKPPSSDIVKKPKAPPSSGKKRQRGGQPGHQRHERAPFADDTVQTCWAYAYAHCPDCGGPVQPSKAPPRVLQQVELQALPIEVSEHRGEACYCPRCQKTHYALIDEPVRRAGLVGPRLTSLIAFLKGNCHCSFSTIRKFVRDVVGVTLSRGQLSKLIAKASASLQATYEQIQELLPLQSCLNVDETGHKDSGEPMWTWCFRASLFTLFKIAPTRSSDVLIEVLGTEFDGVLGCDYFSAYRKYMGECNVLVQFCLAHLLRDVRFLVEHPNSRNQAYGRRVLERMRSLFAVIHRREVLSPAAFRVQLENAGDELWAEAVWRVPSTKEAINLAQRFEKHGESYLRFITTPGIEPTNNLAEQAIRFVVIDRKVTQGTRGEIGQRWLERIWTVIATCAQQGRSVFEFLHAALLAHLHGDAPPELLPANTS